MTTGLGLPEGVDDWATAPTNVLVVPLPRGRVNRLTDRTQNAQAGQVVAIWVCRGIAFNCLDQRTNRSRRSVENRYLVVFDHFPETSSVWVRRNAFEDNLCAAERQRAVGNVSVASHPADVGRTPENVFMLQVERPLGRERSVQQVAPGRVLYTLGLAGRTRGVEQKQRVLGAYPFGFASQGLGVHLVVQPVVAPVVPRHAAAGAPVDEYVLHRFAAFERQRLVDDCLERELLAAAQLLVCRDYQDGTRVRDAVAQALRGETAKNDGVDGAYARTGLHRYDAFDRHAHVDRDAISAPNTACPQGIGKLASACKQRAVADASDLCVVGLEDDGHLIAQARFDLSVQAVV